MELNSTARRGTILMTKILQTLANEVQFGAKENFMVPLNDRMEEHRSLCKEILTKIPLEFDEAVWTPQRLSDEEATNVIRVVHSWLSKETLTNQLWKKVSQKVLAKEDLLRFRKAILHCGTPSPRDSDNANLSPKNGTGSSSTKKTKSGALFKNRSKKDRKEKKRK